MRTQALSNLENKISEINNNLSHTVFVFKQFSIDNGVNATNHPDELTTKIYSANQFANQFNVRLKEIDEQATQSLDYILDTLFVFTNTLFEVYLKDVYLFVKYNSQFTLGEPPDSKVYETILEQIGINPESDLNNLFVSTYDYFRYRRNAIMHRDKEKRFHGAMEDLVKGDNLKGIFRKQQLNGRQLNLEWKRYSKSLDDSTFKGYTIRAFDFANRDISKFTLTELFDVFNFYRLYARILDALILQKIERKYLLKYIFTEYQKNYGTDLKSSQEFIRGLKQTNKLKLNLDLTTQETTDIFENGI